MDINTNNNNKKRARDDSDESSDSETNYPESKLLRVGSAESVGDTPESYPTQVDSNNSDVNSVEESSAQTQIRVDSVDSGMNSGEVLLIQDDLLNILDDSETVTDRDPAIQDLDSVIKSFEKEIQMLEHPVIEMTSGSASPPELGYLLEASDDELGLPPTNGVSEEGKMEAADFTTSGSEAVGLDGMLGFENDMIPSYDSFEFGFGGNPDTNMNSNYNGGDYVALGGLFDYSDGGVSEFSWRTESLSAL